MANFTGGSSRLVRALSNFKEVGGRNHKILSCSAAAVRLGKPDGQAALTNQESKRTVLPLRLETEDRLVCGCIISEQAARRKKPEEISIALLPQSYWIGKA